MKSVVVAIFLTLLAGCATLDRESRAPFVGNWLYADKVQSCRYSFDADGSFRGEVTSDGATISRFTGRWTVKKNALLYTYLTDAFGRIPPGATDRDEVLQVDRDAFVIRAANGERRRYRRVR
jgi:hypothetical protein